MGNCITANKRAGDSAQHFETITGVIVFQEQFKDHTRTVYLGLPESSVVVSSPGI